MADGLMHWITETAVVTLSACQSGQRPPGLGFVTIAPIWYQVTTLSLWGPNGSFKSCAAWSVVCKTRELLFEAHFCGSNTIACCLVKGPTLHACDPTLMADSLSSCSDVLVP